MRFDEVLLGAFQSPGQRGRRHVEFDSRFAVSGSGGDRDTVTFRQGVAGYDGTVDTQLHEGNPDTEYGGDSSITADGADDAGDPVWASDTAGAAATELVLREDGALVLSDGDGAVWSANGS